MFDDMWPETIDVSPGDGLQAPLPYFGGKSRAASLIWERFGDVPVYAEPFAGSLAVLLGRPHEPRIETVNDLDGFLCNVWRAIAHDPEGTAHWADWPVSECDLTARHAWLVARRDDLTSRLMGDPDYFDAKIAGYWLWGIAAWIGSGWCSGQGPWVVEDGMLVDSRQRPHLGNAGRGVHRKRPHLGNAGMGVHRQLHSIDSRGGKGVHGTTRVGHLVEWFGALSDRLRRVRVCCGDWTRVLTPAALAKGANRTGFRGILLDPPYSTDERTGDLYAMDSGTVAAEVREWAIAHGDDPRFRIALCGYSSEHAMPDTWTAVRWTAHGGYGSQAKGSPNLNKFREMIWFSPACLTPEAELPLFRSTGI